MTRNFTNDKLLYHTDRLFGVKEPITADIFLTNYCNNRCPYCTYSRWGKPDAYAMTLEDFAIYARRLISLGVRGMILTGGGEPTINPDFSRITDWLEFNGIEYGINTNFNELRFCKPNYLKVSLDGWDEDSYESFRGVRAYQKTVDNIRRYAEWRDTNSPKTILGVQQLSKTAEDVLRFYEANKALPVNYFSFRPVESTAGVYYKDEAAQHEMSEVVKAIKEIALRDSRVTLHYKWSEVGNSDFQCVANWAQIAINEHGNVMYCCHKPYEIVGHILDVDILTQKARAATDISMCDVPCRMTASNVVAGTLGPPTITSGAVPKNVNFI